MSNVKWIKVNTDIFDDEKILLIEDFPKSDSILIIWFKLLCLAGKINNGGVFVLNENIPYTVEMLSKIFRRKKSVVENALNVFQQYGMIEIIDGVITIPKWGKHQSLDGIEKKNEYMKNYMKQYREKQKSKVCKTNSKTNSKVNVSHAEEDRDRDKDKDIKKNKVQPIRHKYGTYQNVLLSDEDMEKLKVEFPTDYEDRIERVSMYCKSKGKSYSDYLATIRNWARKENNGSGVQEVSRTDEEQRNAELDEHIRRIKAGEIPDESPFDMP